MQWHENIKPSPIGVSIDSSLAEAAARTIINKLRSKRLENLKACEGTAFMVSCSMLAYTFVSFCECRLFVEAETPDS